MISPDRKRELEQLRWVRDHPEEAAGKYGPNDIRRQHPELLRSGAQKMIDLIEKGKIPGRR